MCTALFANDTPFQRDGLHSMSPIGQDLTGGYRRFYKPSSLTLRPVVISL
jgi:hypothetical protein